MSRIIDIGTDTGLDLYLILVKPTNQNFANFGTQAFEVQNDANWDSYDLIMAEISTTGYYHVEIPGWVADADYSFVIYRRIDASPANTDEKVNAGTKTISSVAAAVVATGNTEAKYQAQLILVQTAIDTALATPKPNYRVGQVTYSHADYINMLFDQQKKLADMINLVPQESMDTVQSRIDQFGVDLIDYKNEPNL